MENFIEKLKTVDKKVWIGVGIGAAVVIILIVALIIGLGNNKSTGGKGDSQNGTQYGTETEGGVTEVFGTEDVTEVLGTEMATETEMGTETEMTESESQSESQNKGETTSNVTVTQSAAVNGVEQTPVTKTEDGKEILGLGSSSQPYEVIPELSTMTVTTVEVPAGKTLYYNIQRVGGMYLTINDADAYVITSSGKKYTASNGKVAFTVESAMPNEYVSFQIGNSGSTNKSFTIKFSNLEGSQMNPEKMGSILDGSNSFITSLASGNSTGRYYKYTAEQSGDIKFYVSSFETKTSGTEGMLTVTNNNTMKQLTFFDADVQVDENGKKYVIMPVSAGDEIVVIVSANPVKNKYPAATVTWVAQYQ